MLSRQAIFRFPQSAGIAGGRPSSSYYFVGAQANALFYIDPHHPRPAIPLVLPSDDTLMRAAQHTPFGSTQPPARDLEGFLLDAYNDSAWATYHCERVRKCALASLDPSMLLGFVIENERDWDDFRERVAQVRLGLLLWQCLSFSPSLVEQVLTSSPLRSCSQLSQSSAPIFSIAPSPPRWMRRATSSAQPSPSHPTAASASTAAAAPVADDSFSELDVDDAASGRADPLAAGAPDEASEGFSEPEEWELQSTDGSALGEEDDGEEAGEQGVTPAPGGGASAGALLGEEAVVVPSLAQGHDSVPAPPRKEAVGEGWLGVEAERSG